MKTVVLPVLNKAWKFYRICQPYGYIKDILREDIFIYDPSVHGLEKLGQELNQADLVVYQSPCEERHLKLIRAITNGKGKKRKCVVDYDDDVFNISPWSPAYEKYGTKETSVLYTDKEQVKGLLSALSSSLEISNEQKDLVKVNPDGTASVAMWKDKTKGFDIEENLKRLENIQKILNEADVLTVTTPQLADKFMVHRTKDNIIVLPNIIDLGRYLPMNKTNDGKVRIIWQGGPTHYRDLEIVKLELISFANKHPEVEYVFKGIKYPGLFNDIADRVSWMPWHSDIETFPSSLREMSGDIAICPLTDDTFNDGKSPLKWEEMSAMKVPCVCSPTLYGNYIEHGRTGLIARQGEWEACLEQLLDGRERERIGQNAYDHVRKNFSIERASVYWEELQGVLSGKS